MRVRLRGRCPQAPRTSFSQDPAKPARPVDSASGPLARRGAPCQSAPMGRLAIGIYLCCIVCLAWSAPAGAEMSADADLAGLTRRAEQGEAAAQYRLGIAYAEGKIVSRDSALASKWYQAAAEQGHAAAQTRLGVLYAEGNGVPRSVEQAASWYRKAAEQGEVAGQRNLGLAYLEGEGVAQDDAVAADWIRKSAEHGFAASERQLAMLCEGGRGVPPDAEQAHDWYVKAAAHGDSRAVVRLLAYGCLEAQSCTRRHGVGLTYATRAVMRQALRNAGAIPTREDMGFVRDTYVGGDATRADEVIAAYLHDELYELVYRYEDDGRFAAEVASLTSEFGKPGSAEGDFAAGGKAERRWSRADGIEVRAVRCEGCRWNDIAFEVPTVKALAEARSEEDKPVTRPAAPAPAGEPI